MAAIIMDNESSDPKRARLGPGSWSNGHPLQRSVLPPPGPPGQYPPSQPFPRKASQGHIHRVEEHRRHEAEFVTPIQDQRPPSVATYPYQSYGQPREPLVKRDQLAEPVQLQYHRPHSTGDISEDNVNTFPLDDPFWQSISYKTQNRPPAVSNQPYRPPPAYAPPMYASPNPPYDRQPYEPPPTPGGFRDQIHLNIAYASSSGPNYNRRRAPRTSQACDACRAAKAKCDDPKPCSSCKEKDIECIWKTPEPKHGDKVQTEILDTLRTVLHRQEAILEKVETLTPLGKRHERLKQALIKLKPELEVDLMSDDGEDKGVKKEDAFANLNRPSTIPRRISTPDNVYTQTGFGYSQDSPDDPLSAEEEEEAWKRLLPGEPAIPVGHTTGAARLLLWPSVENFLADRLKEEKKSLEAFVEYPNIQENRHGIRLYGQGPGSSRSQSSEGSPEDAFSDISASPSPDVVYGQVGGLTPPPNYPGQHNISVHRRPEERRGGAGEGGQLELDKNTVYRLVDSYLKHMHIMHPILNPAELRAYAKRFIKTLPPDLSKPKSRTQPMGPPPKFVGSGAETPGGKRKRSAVNSLESADVIAPFLLKPGRPQRSIKNAVLLLVLALGKIFEHREKIPDLLPDYESSSGGSPHARSGFPSSMLASSVVSNQSSGLPSPQEGDRSRQTVRRASTESFLPPQALPFSRNLDVIPGLAYAAFAIDILGNEVGESTLRHVQANILASLYFGQLARPAYSHQWLINASTKLQIILRLKLGRLRKYRPDPYTISVEPEKLPSKDNPVIFAFWTCLQLESDIVAELDLPHSGITTLEKHMPWPNLEAAKEDKILNAVQAESYQAQLYLRNHLNAIHQKVYGVGQMGKSLEEDYKLPVTNAQIQFPVIEAMVDSIPNMNTVAPSMVWKEDDPPANDILSARLRAKYYGTEVITYRPFLKMVMNRPSRLAQVSGDNPTASNRPEEVISTKILDYARLCIRAMENSTRAFHGMGGGRLIVTNVWGTAHAQWGNVILLQTAHQDPLLQPYIDRGNLKQLVVKTLKFIGDVADPASALMTDLKILKFAAQKTGFISGPSPMAEPDSSFLLGENLHLNLNTEAAAKSRKGSQAIAAWKDGVIPAEPN